MSGFINTSDVIGDYVLTDSIIDRSITEIRDDRVRKVRTNGFHGCQMLTIVDFPNATTVGANAFDSCINLVSVNLPSVTILKDSCFLNCSKLKRIRLPNVLGYLFENYTFQNCAMLELIDVGGSCTGIGSYRAIYGCTSLKALVLRNKSERVSYPSGIETTPIASGTGYIYVPRALVDQYKSGTNWSTYGDQFRALEDYTVDGTTTGELDESKI